jgi:hypothetical protein
MMEMEADLDQRPQRGRRARRKRVQIGAGAGDPPPPSKLSGTLLYSFPWSRDTGGRDELARLAGSGGRGQNRLGSKENRRRRLGF